MTVAASTIQEQKQEGFWQDAEVISSYSRQNAIDDGILIEENVYSTEFFKIPVCITSNLLHLFTSKKGLLVGYLKDMYSMAILHSRMRSRKIDRLLFKMTIGRRVKTILVVCGPSDDTSPCLTFMLPEDE